MNDPPVMQQCDDFPPDLAVVVSGEATVVTEWRVTAAVRLDGAGTIGDYEFTFRSDRTYHMRDGSKGDGRAKVREMTTEPDDAFRRAVVGDLKIERRVVVTSSWVRTDPDRLGAA